MGKSLTPHTDAANNARWLADLFERYYQHPGDGDEAFWDVFGEIEPGELAYIANLVADYLENEA